MFCEKFSCQSYALSLFKYGKKGRSKAAWARFYGQSHPGQSLPQPRTSLFWPYLCSPALLFSFTLSLLWSHALSPPLSCNLFFLSPFLFFTIPHSPIRLWIRGFIISKHRVSLTFISPLDAPNIRLVSFSRIFLGQRQEQYSCNLMSNVEYPSLVRAPTVMENNLPNWTATFPLFFLNAAHNHPRHRPTCCMPRQYCCEAAADAAISFPKYLFC